MPHTTHKQTSLKKELVKVLAARTFTPKDLEEAIEYLKDKTTQARILKHASDQKCLSETTLDEKTFIVKPELLEWLTKAFCTATKAFGFKPGCLYGTLPSWMEGKGFQPYVRTKPDVEEEFVLRLISESITVKNILDGASKYRKCVEHYRSKKWQKSQEAGLAPPLVTKQYVLCHMREKHFTKTERDLVMKYVDQNSLCIDDVRPKFRPGVQVEWNDGTVIDTVVIEDVHHSWDAYFNCWLYKVNKQRDGAVCYAKESNMWVEE